MMMIKKLGAIAAGKKRQGNGKGIKKNVFFVFFVFCVCFVVCSLCLFISYVCLLRVSVFFMSCSVLVFLHVLLMFAAES